MIPAPVREAVLERDGHRCRWCGRAARVEAHHIRYRSQGGGHDPGNLIALCQPCHSLVRSDKHRYKALPQRYMTYREETGAQLLVAQFIRWHEE